MGSDSWAHSTLLSSSRSSLQRRTALLQEALGASFSHVRTAGSWSPASPAIGKRHKTQRGVAPGTVRGQFTMLALLVTIGHDWLCCESHG